jgi:hypothetical protein
MFNTLVKDQASLMSQQQQQLQQMGNAPSSSSTSPLRQTPTSNPPNVPTTQNNPQGQFGGTTSSLIYSLLANTNTQQPTNTNTSASTIRNPSPFQQPQQNIFQTQQLQEQIQRQLAQQSLGQRMGSMGSTPDMSYLMLNNNANNASNDMASALMQQHSQSQFAQGPMVNRNNNTNNNMMFSYGGTQNDLTSTLLQQPQQHNLYGQYTGPGGIGGGMDLNGLLHQQQPTQQQPMQYTNGYPNLQSYQFPNNVGGGMMNTTIKPNTNPTMGNLLGTLNVGNMSNLSNQQEEELNFGNFSGGDPSESLLLEELVEEGNNGDAFASIMSGEDYENDPALSQILRNASNRQDDSSATFANNPTYPWD